MNNDILYIGAFLGSTILVNTFAGLKATYYYLLLVLGGVMVVNVGRYNIKIVTPEIMTEGSSGSSGGYSTGSGGGMIDLTDLTKTQTSGGGFTDLTKRGASGGGSSGGF